jgi:hypothetical protein
MIHVGHSKVNAGLPWRLYLYCFQLVAEKPLNEERMEGKTSAAVSQTTRLLRLRSALR